MSGPWPIYLSVLVQSEKYLLESHTSHVQSCIPEPALSVTFSYSAWGHSLAWLILHSLYSEKQHDSVSDEPMYPEHYYRKFDTDIVDNTINKYELTNEDGTYTYTQDLLALEEKRPIIPPLLPLIGSSITSPLIVHNWSSALENHPDREFVHYIL